MLKNRMEARKYLRKSNRPDFLETVYRAKVTPRQKDILYKKFLDGYSNVEISMKLSISVETVRDELAAAYDLLFRYLFTA